MNLKKEDKLLIDILIMVDYSSNGGEGGIYKNKEISKMIAKIIFRIENYFINMGVMNKKGEWLSNEYGDICSEYQSENL